MKKIFFLLVIAFFCNQSLVAQAPQGINYQAVIRDNFGALLANQSVGIRINIRSNAANGTIVFAEQHSVSTNANGLINLVIGSGTPIMNTFPNINWGNGNSYFAEILADITGGISYQSIGVQQFMAVPYAFYAQSGGNSYTAGNGLALNGTTFSAQSNQAIWNANNLQSRAVSSTAPTNGQFLMWNGSSWIPVSLNAGTGINYSNQNISAQNTQALWNANQLQGSPLDASAPALGQALIWNGTAWQPTALVYDPNPSDDITTATTASGDLSGFYPAPNVVAVQNQSVSSTPPVAGQVLKWNGSEWQAQTDNTSGSLIAYNSGAGIRIDSQYYIHSTLQAGNGISIDSQYRINSNFNNNGSHIHNNNLGNVGIGTNTPNAKLDVQGHFQMSQSPNNFVQFQVPASSNQTTIYQLPTNSGNAGEVLTTNGAGQLSWTSPISGGNGCMTNRAVFSTTGTTTWVVPAGITKLRFKMWSAGGNGSSSGGGGGGGGYAEGFLDVSAGNTVTLKIPAPSAARDTAIIAYNGLYAYLVGGAGGGWGEGGKLVGSNIASVFSFEGEDGTPPKIVEISTTSYLEDYGDGGSSPGLCNGGKAGVSNRWSGGNVTHSASKGGFPGGGGGGGDFSVSASLGGNGLIILEY